ncbi:MAG TPA: Fe-S cluster assembly protein SufD [Verrucomicrobiae bacterium]|jgi:Fe-S cluster assembly protein SufD
MTETLSKTDQPPAAASFFAGGIACGPPWLQSLRRQAQAHMEQNGFPTTDHEEWRFTNVASLRQLPLHAAESAARAIGLEEIKPFLLAPDGYCLVFVDGRFREDLSNLPGDGAALRAGNFQSQWENGARELEEHLGRHARTDATFFAALNTASFHDGAYVIVPARTEIEQPVQLLYLAASERPGAAVQARNLIVAAQGASVKVIESYASLTDASHLTNAVTELALAEDARVEHCRLQNENARAFHIATVQATQGRHSHWLSHSIATGARLARNRIQTVFTGEGGEAILNGLYLARGEQLIDHHTVVDHAKPRCESHEFYFGILAGRARGVFNGKIFVRQDAQKTNAKQTNRNLVLSEHAMVNTKPQLEIYADDVKCTHGATVGQLNEEALFYLRSRGIGAELARCMLIRAFTNDAVKRVTLEAARAHLEQLLTERFEELRLSSHE